MPGELAALRRLSLPNVACLITGVGTRNAERAVSRAWAASIPPAVLHIGFAGALCPSLALGDVLLAGSVGGVCDATPDARLTKLAGSVGIDGVRLLHGAFVTSDRILSSARDKHAVAAALPEHTWPCADMESAVVAKASNNLGIPYLGIRCISDTFDEDLPLDLNSCRDSAGSIATPRVLMALLRRPRALPGLIELQRRAKSCSDILARVVAGILARAPDPSRALHEVQGEDPA